MIVDEEVDFVYHTFDSITISKISNIEEKYLGQAYNCIPIFKEIVHDIRAALAKRQDQMKRIYLEFNDQKLKELRQNLEGALNIAVNKKFVYGLSQKNLVKKGEDDLNKVKRDIMDKINKILMFYNNEDVIIYSNGLYRYDSNITPFRLRNNIWIDASARFNYLYKLDCNLFNINETPRLIDHSNSTLFIDYENSSTASGKQRKYEDLERDVLRDIQTNLNENEKVLIIDNKNECNYMNELIIEDKEFQFLREKNTNCSNNLDDEEDGEIEDDEAKPIETVNFFAMRGRNKWKDHDKCYIIQQPQLIFPYYVFLYEYWTKQNLTDIETHIMNHTDEKSGFSTYGFAIPKKTIDVTDQQRESLNNLELLRQTSQLSSIYQGLKRIQRNDQPNGNFYVILSDLKMVGMLIKQFKNIIFRPYVFEITKKTGRETNLSAKDLLLLALYELDEDTIISYNELAEKVNTSRENILKIIQRLRASIKTICSDRKIILLPNICEGSSYLLNRKMDEIISLEEFEKTYSIKWENFKRKKDAQVIIKHRNIKLKNGKIHIKK